jgi:hypothetical protein
MYYYETHGNLQTGKSMFLPVPCHFLHSRESKECKNDETRQGSPFHTKPLIAKVGWLSAILSTGDLRGD